MISDAPGMRLDCFCISCFCTETTKLRVDVGKTESRWNESDVHNYMKAGTVGRGAQNSWGQAVVGEDKRICLGKETGRWGKALLKGGWNGKPPSRRLGVGTVKRERGKMVEDWCFTRTWSRGRETRMRSQRFGDGEEIGWVWIERG